MSSPKRRYLPWVVIGGPVVVLVIILIVLMQAKVFLRSDRFRTFLGGKVSKAIRAEGVFRPLEWSGTSFYTEGFTAQGREGGTLEAVHAEQLRAEVNLRGLWDRKWQVQNVEIERLIITPAGKQKKSESAQPPGPAPEIRPETRPDPDTAESKNREQTKTAPTDKNTAKKTPGFVSSLLPNQVDVRHVTVAHFDLDGTQLRTPFSLEGLRIDARPDGKAWMLEANDGSLVFPKRPKISIGELSVRYIDQTIFVNHGNLTIAGGGSTTLSGRISERVEKNSDLSVKIERMPVGTVLPEDWRARLHGEVTADLRVTGDGTDWSIAGPVTLENGRLEALPILDQIALFTRTQRFRQLALEKITADLVVKDGVVTISNLSADSPGLLRITGSSVIANGRLDGDFLVGVTPGSLRWIPGSQTRVFTIEKDGYLWTTMKVTGELNHLREDLSGRLATAAGQEIIDTIEKDPNKLKDTLKEAAKSLLDLFGR